MTAIKKQAVPKQDSFIAQAELELRKQLEEYKEHARKRYDEYLQHLHELTQDIGERQIKTQQDIKPMYDFMEGKQDTMFNYSSGRRIGVGVMESDLGNHARVKPFIPVDTEVKNILDRLGEISNKLRMSAEGIAAKTESLKTAPEPGIFKQPTPCIRDSHNSIDAMNILIDEIGYHARCFDDILEHFNTIV